MKLRNFLVAGFLVAACAATHAAQPSAYPEVAAKELESMGYPYVEPMSFAATKSDSAITFIGKSRDDKNALLVLAEVRPLKDGAIVGFRFYRRCIPNDTPPLPETVIVVDGQKIAANRICSIQRDGSTNEVFYPATDAGGEFVKKVFAAKRSLIVRVDQVPVPFLTDGFANALAAASGKAL
jgi:hypothetical protein